MKCYTFAILIVLFALTKVTVESPVANPKAEPCLGFIFGLLASLFRPFIFGGFGGQLGPGFMTGYPYYQPGMYYGAPYYPYPYYPYPYYPGGVVPGGPVNPGSPVIVNPGGPVVVPGGPVNPGGPVIVNPSGPVNPGGPIIVNPEPTSRPIISIGK